MNCEVVGISDEVEMSKCIELIGDELFVSNDGFVDEVKWLCGFLVVVGKLDLLIEFG